MTNTDTETPTTEQVLVSMLTENTGRHMLDSGGAYGRAWERNQGKSLAAFEAEPEAFIDSWGGVTLSVYHFLKERLSYNARIDDLFGEFSSLPEREDQHWLGDMEEFPAWLAETYPDEFGDVNRAVCTVNTYNGEDLLSQTIQFTLFGESSEAFYGEFVLLQIHGGCDVRGGYTRPRAFDVHGECALFDYDRAEVWCDGVEPPQSVTLDDDTFGTPTRRCHYWDISGGYVEAYDPVSGSTETVSDVDFEHNCPECGAKLNAGLYPCG